MLKESQKIKVRSTWNEAKATNFQTTFTINNINAALAVALYEAGKFIELIDEDTILEDVTIQSIHDTWWVTVYTREKN